MKNARRVFIAMLALPVLAAAAEPAAPLPMSGLLQAARTAVETCEGNGYAVTAMIMDADFSTRVVLRGDGAPDRTVEIARRKAYTVIKMGMSSGDFGRSIPQQPPKPVAAASAPPAMPGPVNGDPNLITWAGGLPVKVHGVLVGAMSVSGAPGGDKDEACVRAGLAGLAEADRT